MRLMKDQGGSVIAWEGTGYAWPGDGSVADVPDSFGRALLAIPAGGFSVVTGNEPEGEPEPEGKNPPAAPRPRSRKTPA